MSLNAVEFNKTYRITPSFLQNLWEKFSAIKDCHPLLFYPYTRWTRPRLRWGKTATLPVDGSPIGAVQVDRETEIVIEAYPRTANTFSTAAFHLAQNRPTRIAYHMHSGAQILRGIQYGKPVLSIIRDPDDAVASTIIYIPKVSAKSAFRLYYEFYEALWEYRDRIVMATFEQVTTDFGLVIDKVNAKFGTKFLKFDHTEANVKKCWALADDAVRHDFGDAPHEDKAQRPSEQRKQAKAYVVEMIHSPAIKEYRDRAYAVYKNFLNTIPDLPKQA